MNNKRCIIKIFVMMAIICLLGINYGYWSEQLTVNGEASLLVQVSVVDLVRIETVTKKVNPVIVDKQSEGDNKVPNEENIDPKGKEEKEPSIELPEHPSDIENIDLKDTEGKENEESRIDEEVNEDTSLVEDITLEEDKDNEKAESNDSLDVENDSEK